MHNRICLGLTLHYSTAPPLVRIFSDIPPVSLYRAIYLYISCYIPLYPAISHYILYIPLYPAIFHYISYIPSYLIISHQIPPYQKRDIPKDTLQGGGALN